MFSHLGSCVFPYELGNAPGIKPSILCSIAALLGTEELAEGAEQRNRGQIHFLAGTSNPQCALKSLLQLFWVHKQELKMDLKMAYKY